MTSPESEPLREDSPKVAYRTARRLAGDWVMWLALGSAVAACLAICLHIPYVNGPRGPKQWQWPYMHRDVFLRSLLGGAWRLALGGGLIGGITWLVRRFTPTGAARRWSGLIGLFCWGLFFVWTSLISATPMRLAHLPRIVKSQTWTSYFTLAQWIQTGRRPPLEETLRRYAELIPEFPLHASTHPPGPVVACYGMLRLFEEHPGASAAMGRLYERLGADPGLVGVERFTSNEVAALSIGIGVIVCAQLGVFPIFSLVRLAMRDQYANGRAVEAERTAWVAAALWVHYPALVLMAPAFDLIYPTVTLFCFLFALRGLRDRPVVWGAALGLAFMAGITLVFTLLFLVPMLCLLAWLELARRSGSLRPIAVLRQAKPAARGGRQLWLLAAATVAVCLIIEAILRRAFGIHLMQIFFAAVQNQNENLLPKLNRSFRVWVFYNIWDFLLFAGLPLAVLSLVWLGRGLRAWWKKPASIVPAIAVFPLSILAVDLSHQLSAETARVWLFLAPCLAWAGAAELLRRSGDSWRWTLTGLLLAQTVFIYVCRTNMMLWGF